MRCAWIYPWLLVGCAAVPSTDPLYAPTPPGHVDAWGWVGNILSSDVDPDVLEPHTIQIATDDGHLYSIHVNTQRWGHLRHDRPWGDLLGHRAHLKAAITDETKEHDLGWDETLLVSADLAPEANLDPRRGPTQIVPGTVRRWIGSTFDVTLPGPHDVATIRISPPGLGPTVLVWLTREIVEQLAAEGHPLATLGSAAIEVRGLLEGDPARGELATYRIWVTHREQILLGPSRR